jgi:hypothetical protein
MICFGKWPSPMMSPKGAVAPPSCQAESHHNRKAPACMAALDPEALEGKSGAVVP